jgi:hypothetical protein
MVSDRSPDAVQECWRNEEGNSCLPKPQGIPKSMREAMYETKAATAQTLDLLRIPNPIPARKSEPMHQADAMPNSPV